MSDIIACPPCFMKALLLLLVANGAPIIAELLLAKRFAIPIDAGLRFSDGRPLLGAAKTWRGLICSILLTGLTGWFLHIGLLRGVCFAMLSMMGDMLASFCKRRIGLKESSRSRFLDALPESLLPAAFLKDSLGLDGISVLLLAAVFLFIEEYLSPLLYRLHIRKRPH